MILFIRKISNDIRLGLDRREMDKKVVIALSLILVIMAANMEAVYSDAADCNDACTTACVFPDDPRLAARCNRKCEIKCSPGLEAN